MLMSRVGTRNARASTDPTYKTWIEHAAPQSHYDTSIKPARLRARSCLRLVVPGEKGGRKSVREGWENWQNTQRKRLVPNPQQRPKGRIHRQQNTEEDPIVLRCMISRGRSPDPPTPAQPGGSQHNQNARRTRGKRPRAKRQRYATRGSNIAADHKSRHVHNPSSRVFQGLPG